MTQLHSHMIVQHLTTHRNLSILTTHINKTDKLSNLIQQTWLQLKISIVQSNRSHNSIFNKHRNTRGDKIHMQCCSPTL